MQVRNDRSYEYQPFYFVCFSIIFALYVYFVCVIVLYFEKGKTANTNVNFSTVSKINNTYKKRCIWKKPLLWFLI